MRLIIYTGKGGVGKTSVAAATGIKLACSGLKTLVISTDMAHSLADSYGINLSYNPRPVMKNLWAEELNPQSEMEERWDKIYNYLVHFFKVAGVKDIFAEEMTLLPGMEELFSMLEIYQHYKEKKFDVIILDCPPTASTVRLLSFFDVIGWYMERFFKIKRTTIKVMRTFTDTFMQIPLPEDDFFDAMADIYEKMKEVKIIMSDPSITSIRLVTNPEEMVINESQRSYTYLNLYGFNVDAIIVNKILPEGLEGDYFNKWHQRQMTNLQMIREIFQPIKVFTLPFVNEELRGVDNLKIIAKTLYEGYDPLECFIKINPVSLIKDESGYLYRVYMPFLEKKKFQLYQKGVMVIINVGNYKRKILLPQVLSNKEIKKARYTDKYLNLYFG